MAAPPSPPSAAPPRRNLLLWAAAILAIAVVAGWLWWRATGPVTVRIAVAQARVAEQIFGLGTVGADVQSGVGFKIAGILTAIDANEGDHVKTGQVLAQLDPRSATAQLALAQAGVQQARAAIDKAQADVAGAVANLANIRAISARRDALVKHGYASQEEAQTDRTAVQVAAATLKMSQVEVKTAQAGLAAALAQQAYAQAALNDDTLHAPYDAWVVARNLNLGAMPVPGQIVYTLVEPRTIWVVAYIDERLAGRLRVGQTAEIVLRSEPGHRFPGHVARIEIQSDAVNEERQVDIAFTTLPPAIHLAEQAEVYITTATLPHAVLVPQAAVTGLADGKGSVWTVENGRLARRQVSIGPQLLDGRLPVVAGLAAGVQVVTSPQTGLRAGQAAMVAATP